MRKYFYISPRGTLWVLTYDKRTLYENVLKSEVISMGRATAKKHAPSELLIQNSEGKITQRESYGNDPYPPRG